MRSSIAPLLLLTTIVALVQCAVPTVFVAPHSPQLYYNGRIDTSVPGVYSYDWSAVSIQITFNGSTSVDASFSNTEEDSSGNSLNIVLNGKVIDHLNITSSKEKTYSLFDGTLDASQTYTLQIIKQSEPVWGTVNFYGLYLDSGVELIAPVVQSRKIEFIGDSITCGYGNLGNPPCLTTPHTEDNY
eukprot:gene14609-17274_t